MKNLAGEEDYKAGRFKNKYPCISYLYFVATLPLLPFTMAIKCLSKENKRKFKEMKDIDANKLAKAHAKKIEIEELRMKKEIRKKKKKKKEMIEEEVLKRIESPTLGKMRFLIGELKETKSSVSDPSSPPNSRQEELLASDIQLEIPLVDIELNEEETDLEKGLGDSIVDDNLHASPGLECAKTEVSLQDAQTIQNFIKWFRDKTDYYFGVTNPDLEAAIETPIPISVES